MLKLNYATGEWEGTTGGVDVVELSKRTPTYKIEKTHEQKQAEIHSSIMQNPKYSYAVRLTEYIAEQLELKLGRPVFRNKQISCYQTSTKQIIFGYESVDRAFEKGFAEYAEVGYIWHRHGYKADRVRGCWISEKGMKGIWQIVLHEMAHAMQHTKNGFWRGSIHNQVFLHELDELITLFPYDEVKGI